MNILETMQSVVTLAKAGMTIELQERVMELRQAVLELKEENLRLREDCLEMRQQLEEYSQAPRCPKCSQPAWTLEGSRPHPTFGQLGAVERTYKCSQCGFTENVMVKSGE